MYRFNLRTRVLMMALPHCCCRPSKGYNLTPVSAILHRVPSAPGQMDQQSKSLPDLVRVHPFDREASREAGSDSDPSSILQDT